MAKPQIFEKILKGDTQLGSAYREHMTYYKSDKRHYKCMICKIYVSSTFKRVVRHSLNCKPSHNYFSIDNIPYVKLLTNTDSLLNAKYKKAMYCKSCDQMSTRGHYHCVECKSYCSYEFPRVLKHGMNCRDSVTAKISNSSIADTNRGLTDTDQTIVVMYNGFDLHLKENRCT